MPKWMDISTIVFICVFSVFARSRRRVLVRFEKDSMSRRFPNLLYCYSWATTIATDIRFVVLISDDKDMRQIVNENVYILAPGR